MNKIGRFIFGDVFDGSEFKEDEYFIYIESPMFMCKIESAEYVLEDFCSDFDVPDVEFSSDSFTSMLTQKEDKLYYACSLGYIFTEFKFFNETMGLEALKLICDEAANAYFKLNMMIENNALIEEELLKSEPVYLTHCELNAEEKNKLAEQLKQKTLDSCTGLNDSEHDFYLMILKCVNSLNPDIFTAVQLSLNTPEYAVAREYLLDTTRALSSKCSVLTPDSQGELWAIPLIYNVPHIGDFPFLPRLKYFEPLLKTLFFEQDLNESQQQLNVSQMLLLHSFLSEYSCQSLSLILNHLKENQSVSFKTLDEMKLQYEKDKLKTDTRLVLSWVVFYLNEQYITMPDKYKIQHFLKESKLVLDKIFHEYQEHGEIMVLPPQPIWQALNAGTHEYNMRRLFFIAALLEKSVGLGRVQIECMYQPDLSAFLLEFMINGKKATAMYWVLTPDLVPDRELGLKALQVAFAEFGFKHYSFRRVLH